MLKISDEIPRIYEHTKRTASAVASIWRSQKIHSSCVTKQRKPISPKTLLLGMDDGDDGGGGRILRPGPGPIPSHPGIKYPVPGPPLTPIIKLLKLLNCQTNLFCRIWALWTSRYVKNSLQGRGNIFHTREGPF